MNILGFRGRWFCALMLSGLLGAVCVRPHAAFARETDNFSLPLDVEMADLGSFLEAVHTLALEEAVAAVNARIERALKIQDPEARALRLGRLHDPETLADAFMARLPSPMSEDRDVERALQGKWAKQTFSQRRTTHRDVWMNFSAHIPADPRQWLKLFQSHTVKACGVYFGTDKIVHFHHLGLSYYKMYRSLLKTGITEKDASAKVIEHHIQGGIWGEQFLFGTVSTGIFSNADMAANYAGFKFFQNLTETVVVKGRPVAPLVVRSGVFWRLNIQVRPGSEWFCAFVSDHWNEALNPNLYESSMRPGIRRVLRGRAERIVEFYTKKDGRPNEAAYFEDLARELSTYYGESYGHSGQFEKLMTIGNTCIPALREKENKAAD